MIEIDVEEFKRIRKKVHSVRNLNIPGYTRGMLFTILSQKKVDAVKRQYPEVSKRIEELEEFWKKEKKMPEWLKLTPVMRIRLLLKSHGLSKSAINKVLRDPQEVQSEVDSSFHPDLLEKIVWRALYTDYVYSPLAIKHQRARGKLGEEILKEWLSKRELCFSTEDELRGKFSKTPDFYFEEPVNVNGFNVRWIESKALFGDVKTHSTYAKKQFRIYREMFGEGCIVYWFGHVCELKDNILSTDNFKSQLKNALNDMIVYTAGGKKKAQSLAEKFNATVVDIYGLELENSIYVELGEVRSKDFLEGMCKIIDAYSSGRIIVADENKSWRESVRKDIGWILGNMGFVVVHA